MAAGENQARAGDTPQTARAREKRTRRAKAAADRRGVAPPQKRKIVPILVAVVLTLVVVGVLVNSHNQRVAWEQQYQTAAELFAAGNYKKAVELAEGLPENIAE